jgi:hypothetical protein
MTMCRSDAGQPAAGALEIINGWIKTADRHKWRRHVVEFWVIRDLIEGKIDVPSNYAEQAALFLRARCKVSDDRQVLIDAIKNHKALANVSIF